MTAHPTDNGTPAGDRAGRFRDYFRLQLQFAERLSEATGKALGETVTGYTNLHRRFGLGNPAPGAAPAPLWTRYIEGLEERGSIQARSDWTQILYAEAPEDRPPPGRRTFGCFGCDPPNHEGAIQIHFINVEDDPDIGPLDRRRQAARRAELQTMFGFVRGEYPHARSVIGGSWLYNLEAYRRLFPPAYGAARHIPDGAVRLTGTSSWGQLLDHRGQVKPDIEAALLARLPNLDPAAPWLVFPMRAMKTRADIGEFYAFLDL
jgi:hypothetical protein